MRMHQTPILCPSEHGLYDIQPQGKLPHVFCLTHQDVHLKMQVPLGSECLRRAGGEGKVYLRAVRGWSLRYVELVSV